MAFISIKREVDLQPGLESPAVFHCSQGDKGTAIMVGLKNGGESFTIPSGATIQVKGSRSNGEVFSAVTGSGQGTATAQFTLTEDMTATPGPTWCEVVLTQSTNVLGTANFILDVEESPTGAAPRDTTDATWSWILTKMATENVPSLGATVIQSINEKAVAQTVNENFNALVASDATLSDDLYEYEAKTAMSTATGYKLTGVNGLCEADSDYNLVKFSVSGGAKIRIVSDHKYQFQSATHVPASGTNANLIGVTYGTLSGVVTVPTDATYLVMSTPASGSIAAVYDARLEIKENVAENVSTAEDINNFAIWEQGGLDVYTGSELVSSYRVRTRGYIPTNAGIITVPSSTRGFFVLAYNTDGTYVGTYKTGDTWVTDGSQYGYSTLDVGAVQIANPTYRLRILVYAKDGTDVTTSEYTNWTVTNQLNRLATIETDLSEIEDKLFYASNGVCTPYSWSGVNFTFDGTDILFTVGRVIAYYFDADGAARSLVSASYADTFTVPHGSIAVYSVDDNDIFIKTDAELRADIKKYIILFFNSNGYVKGDWEKYYQLQRIVTLETGNAESKVVESSVDGVVYASSETITSAASMSGTKTLFSGVTLEAGDYILYCNQTDTITSAERNCFWCRKSNDSSMTYDSASVARLNSGLRVWEISLSAGTYTFGLWVHNNAESFSVNNVCLVKKVLGTPPYYYDHLNTKIDTINTNIMSSVGDSFIFITDIHYPNNQMHSVQMAKKICDCTGIKKVMLNGDYINKEDTKLEAIRQINRVCSAYEYPECKTYRVCGNHEYNNPSASNTEEALAKQLSATELRTAILNRDDIVTDPDSLSYYFDNTNKKIRYFVGSVTRSSGIDTNSIKWIAEQLESVPSGYGVVLFMHTLLTRTNNEPALSGLASQLMNIFDAYKAKTSITYDGVTYNYTSCPGVVICALCGDYHLDMTYTTAGGIDVVCTTCDTMQEDSTGLDRDEDTITVQAFDVVTIDTDSQKVYFTRIGAGSDRVITY